MLDEDIAHRVSRIECDLTEIKSAVKCIAESFRILVRVEIQQQEDRDGLRRAFLEIEKLKVNEALYMQNVDVRLREVEINMPTLKLTSGWMLSGLITVAGAFGAAVMAMLIRK